MTVNTDDVDLYLNVMISLRLVLSAGFLFLATFPEIFLPASIIACAVWTC